MKQGTNLFSIPSLLNKLLQLIPDVSQTPPTSPEAMRKQGGYGWRGPWSQMQWAHAEG